MKINTAYLTIKTDKKIMESSSKLRGYFGNEFKDYPLLHNHYDNNSYLYTYPLVQYNVFNGNVTILGIEEGVNTLKEISSEIKTLNLGKNSYCVNEKIIHEKEYEVAPTRDELHYKFVSPWLALNSKNNELFKNINSWKDKKLFLNKILTGNILSMAKGLGIIVNRQIYPKTHLDERNVYYKSIAMKGFVGEFKIKFRIPNFFGLGKGVSNGFGTVKEIVSE
ncbi:MAG: hypothetical protein LBM96_09505 [Methanobrevibacter sp.]|jgi:hypothetical protein|nr:hypothetical protein [Candidatus Methanoflexus mossambicus]